MREFHTPKETTAVSAYIDSFEQAVGLMRRDNLGLPDDYYVSTFVAGLQPYTQHHLQCHKPRDMQEAMWMARRIEKSYPVKKFNNYNEAAPQKRELSTGQSQQPATQSINQQFQNARLKGICYKYHGPWEPGHKKVCKFQKQINALVIGEDENGVPKVIYTDEPFGIDVVSEELEPDCQL